METDRTHLPFYDKEWTLFLDRDGVLNNEIVGSYVTTTDELELCPGVPKAMAALAEIFGTIVVVTNQRGVGRGLMTLETLRDIHTAMKGEIAHEGGRIDRIYSATAVADDDHNRKPNSGMALQAREDFPQIDFRKSVIVGNSLSDMEFGKRLAMRTIFLTTKHEPYDLPNDLIDEQFPSLQDWAKSVAATMMVDAA